jgi:oligopeptide transport system substrate-binding protein
VKTLVQAVSAMWTRALGVEVTPVNEEWQVYLGRLNQHNYDMGAISWSAGLRDAAQYLITLRSDKSQFNSSGYGNPQVDELLRRADGMLDLPARNGEMQQAERIAMDDLPVVPLWFSPAHNLVSARVQGWDNDTNYPQSVWLSLKE